MTTTHATKFSELDYFSQNFNLLFNKRSHYQTSVGAFLTIILIMSGIALVITQGMEFIYKEQPIAAIVTKFDLNTSLLYINRSSLLLAFQIVDKNFVPLNDDSIFTITSRQFINNQTAKNPFQSIPIKLHNCSEAIEDFKVLNLTRYYEKNSMTNAYCMENGTKIVGGEFNTAYFSNLWLEVRFCLNSTTSKTVCKSQEVIDNTFRGAYFEFYYIDSLYVADNFNNPFKKIMKNYFLKLDPEIEKMTEMYFQKLRVMSDGGAFIFENWFLKEDFTYDFMKEEYQIMQPGGNRIMAFTINSSYNNIEIKRRYLDLVSFAGDMGGIVNLLALIFGFINNYVIKYKMLEDIFNSLYDFRLDDDESFLGDGDLKRSSIADKFCALLEERPNYSFIKKGSVSLEFQKGLGQDSMKDKILGGDYMCKDFLVLAENNQNFKSLKSQKSKGGSPSKAVFNPNLFLSVPMAEFPDIQKKKTKKEVEENENNEVQEVEMYTNPSNPSDNSNLSMSKDSDNINDINSGDQRNKLLTSVKEDNQKKESKPDYPVIMHKKSSLIEDNNGSIKSDPKNIIVSKRDSNSSSSSDDFENQIKKQSKLQVITTLKKDQLNELLPQGVPHKDSVFYNSIISSDSSSNVSNSNSKANLLRNIEVINMDSGKPEVKKKKNTTPLRIANMTKKKSGSVDSANAANILKSKSSKGPRSPKNTRKTSQFASKSDKNTTIRDLKDKENTDKEDGYSSYKDANIKINIDTKLLQELTEKDLLESKKSEFDMYKNENETRPGLLREREYLLKKLEEFRKQEKKILTISYFEIFCGFPFLKGCIKKYRKKLDVINKTEIESTKYLDYLDIIKLLQEFTKFKVFFMSLSQIKLFSFISKPNINMKDDNEKTLKNDLIHGAMFDNNQSLTELYNHYLILKRTNKSKNEKLFNLIDDDILHCFECMRELNI